MFYPLKCKMIYGATNGKIVDEPRTRDHIPDHTVSILIIPKRLKSHLYDLDQSTVYA